MSLVHVSRNLTAEKVCASLALECGHTKEGCKQQVTYKTYNEYVTTCDFRPVQCVMKNCKWLGPLDKLVEHMTMEHNGRSYDSGSWLAQWNHPKAQLDAPADCSRSFFSRVQTGILSGLTDDERVMYSVNREKSISKALLRVVFWHVTGSPKDTEHWRIKFTMSGPNGLQNSWCGPIANIRTSHELAIAGTTTFELFGKLTRRFNLGRDLR